MLLSLRLRNFVIVDELELHFQSGFTVLTGETGAGKSILIDALGLLLGERADAGIVRHGADKADLAAEFSIEQLVELNDYLREGELEGDDDSVLLLRRTIDQNGRSRAFVNGQSATATQLKEIGEHLLDIHGQHAHQSLLRADAQRNLLDAFAGKLNLAQSVKVAFNVWRQAESALSSASKDAERLTLERDQVAAQVDDLASLQLGDQEWSHLQSEHQRLSNAASLIQGSQAALASLAEDDGNAQSLLASAQSRLQSLADIDPVLGESAELIATAAAHLSEAVHALRRYADRAELDPARLAEAEQRMDDIYRMARKYRLEPEQLPQRLLIWRDKLASLAESADIERLRAAASAAAADYQQLAAQLSTARHETAERLAGLVTTEMQRMAMAGSRFNVALLPSETAAVYGLEQVEFQVAPHASAPARSIAKVASGGELSRISLALQVVTSQVANVPTLIFDEVDVGIGGSTAQIVGQLLRQLGERHQVLCVTHLPQVAACGNQQLQVSKQQIDGSVSSQIVQLDAEGRIAEIARMLGGVEITNTTRQHAAELLGIS